MQNCVLLDEDSVVASIDLTRIPESASGIRGADCSDADAGNAGPSRGKSKKKKIRNTTSTSVLDHKPDLDCISRDELFDMGVTNVGAVGLKCSKVVDAILS